MSLQESTFNTAHVLDNEIIKANDFEYAFEKIAENVSKATQMILESNQDFVINGKVLPYEGMDVQISPIYGVCKQNGLPFGRTETAVMEYRFEESNSGRVDIIEVKGAWETFDNQQRAFNDPDTNVQTYQYVDTKKLMRPVYQIKQGVEGAAVAPSVDSGWVKLAEVVIRAGATEILEDDIKNITSDVAGLENSNWTNDTTATYNIGYISDVNARFRVQHNADGTHKENVINTDSLSIGVGSKQVNGSVLPVGGNVAIPTQTVTPTDSLLSVYTKIAAMITSFYNLYMKYGEYNFKGGIALSNIADETGSLVDPFVIMPDDGAVIMKIGDNVCLTIDSDGKLSTNGYTASASNHIITKAVSDALKQDITILANRVTEVETRINGLDVSANNVISDKFAPDNTSIYAATTENITLQGSQVVDGITPAQGVNILVKNQTNAKENGVYVVSSNSVWLRLSTLSTPDDLVGKIFTVSNGTTNAGKMFYSPQENFLNGSDFGTDDIIFSEYNGTPKPIANKVMVRDSCGRAQVAAPATACDIARKQEIDNLYGNTVGTALGTAAVGTATTFARSDHVHPLPSCVAALADVCNSSTLVYLGYANSGLTCSQIANFAMFSTNYATGKVVVKDASKETVQCFLGLGSAAYCAAGCFRASTWTPSVVDCSKRLTACDDTKVCLFTEGGNEINMKFGNSTNVVGWLNYRGGVCAIKIGLGTGNGCLGDVYAGCFCGSFCGTASSALNATCLGGATASDSATNSSIAKRTSAGYLYANIYHDCWSAENISSYTSTVMFRSSDGFLRNTSKDNLKTWLGTMACATCAAFATCAACAWCSQWHVPVKDGDFKVVGCGLCALKSFFYMPKSTGITPSPTAPYSCINMRFVYCNTFFAGCSCLNEFIQRYLIHQMY